MSLPSGVVTTRGVDNLVASVTSDGSLGWAAVWGNATDYEYRGDVSAGADGSALVAGFFSEEIDLDPTAGEANYTPGGGDSNAYALRFDNTGAVAFDAVFASTGRIEAFGAEATSDGGSVLVGWMQGGTADLDPGTATVPHTPGAYDGWIAKLDSTGALAWTGLVEGSSGGDQAPLIEVEGDATSNLYVLGYFTGTFDLDPSAGVDERTSSGGTNALLVKLDADGNTDWVKTIGGTTVVPYGLDWHEGQGLLVTGYFLGDLDWNEDGTADCTATDDGEYDVFLTALDTNGGVLWTQCYGGEAAQVAYYGAWDDEGELVVTGQFSGTTDFQPGDGSYEVKAPYDWASYVLTLDGSHAVERAGYPEASPNGVAALDSHRFVTGRIKEEATLPDDTVVTPTGDADLWIVRFD